MKELFELLEYVTEDGKKPFSRWLFRLKDVRGRALINSRLKRIVLGNFGDCKSLSGGVWELRVDFGPGYRAYFAKEGTNIVLLLCGGDKGSQKRDIQKAIEYLTGYRRRTNG